MMATAPDRGLDAVMPLIRALGLNKATREGGFAVTDEATEQLTGDGDVIDRVFTVSWSEFVKRADGTTVMEMDGPLTRWRSARIGIVFNESD